MCRLLDDADALHRERVPWLFVAPPEPPRPPHFFTEYFDGESAVAFVAQAEHVIGVVLASLRDTPAFPVFRQQEVVMISCLVVDAAWRRRGAGTLLTRAAESWAAERGAAWIELDVYQANPEAHHFYERLGFTPVSSKLHKPLALRDCKSADGGRWTVWRQDDNGIRMAISSGHSRSEATHLCAEFEARSHKQLYWIAPDSPTT